MKQKIKIMTDSASDIPQDIQNELDIEILCFPLTVAGKGYTERVDFTNEEFYEILLNEPTIPTTAQITSFVFIEKFVEMYKAGYTDLVYVAINSKGSNTYQAALVAMKGFYENNKDAQGVFNIHIVDSKTYTVAYGYPVVMAAQKALKSVSAREIVSYLEDWFDSVEVYFAPYTLEFVKKSGRVSAAAGFVGELLGVKPIISIIDGETKIVSKVRGNKAVIPALLDAAKQSRVPGTPILLVKGMLDDEAEELKEKTQKLFKCNVEAVYQVGAAITINAGPKVVGIIVKGQNRNQ